MGLCIECTLPLPQGGEPAEGINCKGWLQRARDKLEPHSDSLGVKFGLGSWATSEEASICSHSCYFNHNCESFFWMRFEGICELKTYHERTDVSTWSLSGVHRTSPFLFNTTWSPSWFHRTSPFIFAALTPCIHVLGVVGCMLYTIPLNSTQCTDREQIEDK